MLLVVAIVVRASAQRIVPIPRAHDISFGEFQRFSRTSTPVIITGGDSSLLLACFHLANPCSRNHVTYASSHPHPGSQR